MTDNMMLAVPALSGAAPKGPTAFLRELKEKVQAGGLENDGADALALIDAVYDDLAWPSQSAREAMGMIGRASLSLLDRHEARMLWSLYRDGENVVASVVGRRGLRADAIAGLIDAALAESEWSDYLLGIRLKRAARGLPASPYPCVPETSATPMRRLG